MPIGCLELGGSKGGGVQRGGGGEGGERESVCSRLPASVCIAMLSIYLSCIVSLAACLRSTRRRAGGAAARGAGPPKSSSARQDP